MAATTRNPVQDAFELYRELAAEIQDSYALRFTLAHASPDERETLRTLLRRCRQEREAWTNES